MDLYKYLENVIDKKRIDVFKGDEYELALVRYVLKETSKLFYRNAIFFLNEEHIKERYLVYDYKFNPKDITSFEIVCSTYCNLLKEVLENKYSIQSTLITTDNDVFKHVALLVTTKKNNTYFVDPLMEMMEMKSGMRTSNFAIKNTNENPYLKIEINNLSYLKPEVLEKIDEKIGYTKNNIYTDDVLKKLKRELEKIDEMQTNNDNKLSFNNGKFIDFKILAFIDLIRKTKKINGIVELMMFVKLSLKNILTKDEIKEIKVLEFFVDEQDLKDDELIDFIYENEARTRGILIKTKNSNIIISTKQLGYIRYNSTEWEKKVDSNNIFIRQIDRIIMYKYLSELDLEPNILNHREFLKNMKKIEARIIKDGNNPKDYIHILNRELISIKYNDIFIEFGLEQDMLYILDKKNNIKAVIEFNDEGRCINYNIKNGIL